MKIEANPITLSKIAMIGVSGNPSTRMSSHNAGWTFALLDITTNKFGSKVDIIKDFTKIHAYDKLIINNGINFKGKFNFFGGVSDKTVQALSELTKYKGQCYTYNEKIDWSVLATRKEIDKDILTQLPEVEVISTITKCGSHIIIGDSHALSIYSKGHAISRNDGKTLHGFLKNPEQFLDVDYYDNVTLYFGNIDIRFHIGRQDDSKAALNKLIKDYSDYAKHLIDHGIIVTIQGLLPIEDESRKIPGTGLYLGEPFYGTQKDRQSWVNYFNEEMEKNSHYFGFTFRKPWLDAPLSFDVMEARQSVHVRPEYYLNAKEFIYVDEVQFLLPSSKTQTSLFS